MLVGRRLPVIGIFLFLQPIAVFASLRGTSGKDSELYLQRFYSLSENWRVDSVFDEPLLNSIIYISKYWFDGNHVLFFFIHSQVVILLFSLIVSRYRDARVYLLTIGPMFLIDGLTNGMRVTIAYHLFAVFYLLRSRILGPALVAFSHVSGILMYMFNVFFRAMGRGIGYQLSMFLLVIAGVFLFYIAWDVVESISPRISGKLDRYSEMTLATSYSGIVDVFVFVCIATLMAFRQCRRARNFFAVFIGIVILAFFMMYLNQLSLAFIRVWKLLLVSLCFYGVFYHQAKKLSFLPLFLIGLIYSANFMRQVLSDPGFLPYPGPV